MLLAKDKTEGNTIILTSEPYSIIFCQVDKKDAYKKDLQTSVGTVLKKHDYTHTRLCISLLTENL